MICVYRLHRSGSKCGEDQCGIDCNSVGLELVDYMLSVDGDTCVDVEYKKDRLYLGNLCLC